MKNINDVKTSDIKDISGVKKFADQGYKELEVLFSDTSNHVNGEWYKYVSNITVLRGRFIFDHKKYVDESAKLVVDYYKRKNNKQVQKREEILDSSRKLREDSRKLRETYEESLSSQYGH